MRADSCNVIPTCLSLAPCSGPSRRGLETDVCGEPSATASLDGLCARCPARCAGRDEGTAHGTNKGTATDKEKAMT